MTISRCFQERIYQRADVVAAYPQHHRVEDNQARRMLGLSGLYEVALESYGVTIVSLFVHQAARKRWLQPQCIDNYNSVLAIKYARTKRRVCYIQQLQL